MILALSVVCIAFGFAVGRWWALVAPAVVGIFIAAVADVEGVSSLYLGAVYGALGAAWVAVGVGFRLRGRRRRR